MLLSGTLSTSVTLCLYRLRVPLVCGTSTYFGLANVLLRPIILLEFAQWHEKLW